MHQDLWVGTGTEFKSFLRTRFYLWGQDGTNTVVVETVNPTHIGVVVAISLKCYKVISEISNKSITSGVVTAFSVASFLKS